MTGVQTCALPIYAYKLPQKVRRLALKSVYSEKVAENKFVAVDSLEFTDRKSVV